MERSRLKDKFRGALLGAAVGDALGAPFEGTANVNETSLALLDGDFSPTRYTDDTHMTLGLGESLAERRGFDGLHMAHTFARNFNAEPWRGYGAGPPQVFRLLEQGVPWYEAGRRLFNGDGSFGNGAAMRVAPAALFAFPSINYAARLARDTAIITHSHEMAVEGAALQVCAIAYLLHHDTPVSINVRLFLADVAEHLEHNLYEGKLVRIEALLPDASPDQVLRLLGNGIAAHESIPTAIYSFLRHQRIFPDAVRYAISLGGDTDTIASMTGALSGVYLGESAIPQLWRERVEGAGRLRELADALLELATGPGKEGKEG